MWHGMLFVLGMVVSSFAGGIGDVWGIVIAAVLFAAMIILAKIEVKDEPIYLFGIVFALIWLGATAGLSWPFLRWPLAGLGGLIGVFLFTFWPNIKAIHLEKLTAKGEGEK